MLTKKLSILFIVFSCLIGLSAAPAIVSAQKKDEKAAKKLVAEGNEFYRQRQYRLAADRFAQAIPLTEKNAEIYYWKGNSLLKIFEYGEALKDLNAALEKGYKPLEIYKLRWEANYNLKNYDDALRDLEEWKKAEPENTLSTLPVGDIYRSQEKYQEAIAAYKIAAEKSPANAEIPYYIAYSYYKLGDAAGQLAAATRAVGMNTRFPGNAWYLIGDAERKNKNWEAAVNAFEKAIIGQTEFKQTYLQLADIYQNQNNLKEAVATLNKGLKIYPDDPDLIINLSWYYSLNDENPSAVRYGQKAVEVAPTNYLSHTRLCRAYISIKQYKLAIESCNKAIAINPDAGEAYYYLGRAYAKLEDNEKETESYQKAVAGLEKTATENPDNSDNVYLLANAYFSTTDYDKAAQNYLKVISINPKFAQAYFNLGVTYFSQDKKDEALKQVEALKDLDPKRSKDLLDLINKK